MLAARGRLSTAREAIFVVVGLLCWLGVSSSKADELIDDKVIQKVLRDDPCPVESEIEGPPQIIGFKGETERDMFRLKRIAGGNLQGEFCVIESLRFAPPTQSLSVLYRRDKGPWRKVEEGLAMEVLETRTNGYPDIRRLEYPPGALSRAERTWSYFSWDGTKYRKKSRVKKKS
ncbi:hypothetical protein DF3PA_460003 [Candidatus Defluviicoccus seviourii]|uniref:Uncharacterized protein n=2 Tax=root TaxID=1 RepID=A0A564WIC4_9PROT|nr:hypothetical protein DF3PB_1740004 [uncultured Defluviicoccus sp.]VUX47343.1 hypothetical protein DF3PA_460003 [Candidatus Defluviicoccus seviourii]